MKNYQKNFVFLILFGLFLNIHTLYSQTKTDITIYNWFDKIVGKNNLDICNGVLYTNPYRTIDNNNLYYLNDKFENGSLTYNGQIYYNVSLKYDVYRDLLIVNQPGSSDLLGISLNNERVNSFTILNNNFIRVVKEKYNHPDFSTGYYETTSFNEDFIFYIRHSKTIQKKIRDDGAYYYFKDNSAFYLDYKNTLHTIAGKSDLVKLFPEQKKQINEFYLSNRSIRKSDLNQFMKNLMKYINNSLSNQAK